MKYNVHQYAVIRIKVSNITAESQREAMDKADEEISPHLLSLGCLDEAVDFAPFIEHIEPAEEVVGYLVDEVGDEEYEKTTLYGANKEVDKGKSNPTVLLAAAKYAVQFADCFISPVIRKRLQAAIASAEAHTP